MAHQSGALVQLGVDETVGDGVDEQVLQLPDVGDVQGGQEQVVRQHLEPDNPWQGQIGVAPNENIPRKRITIVGGTTGEY